MCYVEIKKKSFFNLPSLQTLDMSYNFLDGYNEFGFEDFDFNGSLYLDFNFIKKLGNLFFSIATST